ncbi:hypothetical protein EMIHUDRAFT_60777, partial [Emiliania huxleyi CCMP1516]|uniref:EF-hand domain-containing protein n=2 Tax=Emiliania huxleyi TaxID=2903 RepID=A0A0D3I1Q1_EMIH1
DRDGNGHIEARELSSVMRRLGLKASTEGTTQMMDAADVDGNGQIEFPEFVLIMGKRVLEEDGRVELECAFRLLAQQGSGLVKVEDVKALLTTAGQ